MRLFESGGRDLQAIAADGEPGTGAVWAPDESAVAFTSRAQPSQVFAVSTSGQSAARPLSTAAADPRFVREVVSDWSRDGRLLAVTRTWLDGNRDIWSVEAKPEGQSKPVVGSAANESEGRFSPDGAWLAYSSDESGVCEVYLITLEGATFRVRVSEGGGRAPLWSRDGQQLYFVDDRDVIWVASLAFDEVASVTKVERLFALGEPASTLGPHARPFFSLTADGGKWLAARPTANLARAPLTAFPDWSVLVAEAGRRDGS